MSGSLRSVFALLILTAISASAGAAAAANPSKKPKPKQVTFFVAPPFSVGCYVSDRRLVCSSYKQRPTLSMRRKGKVRKGSVRGSPSPPVAPQILAEGEEWSDGPYACLHRHTGLTCRNLSSHGWWIGRNGRYRRF
jgi:hypothetical protein